MATLFFIMVTASIFFMLVFNPSGVLAVMLASSANGIQLGITLCGIYIVWMGIVQIAIDAGLIDKLARLLSPIIRFLFGKQSKEVNNLIATNISANMIGAGAVATPVAIEAIERMNRERAGLVQQPDLTRPSTPMIMLFILSATSMQILPTTVIGLLEKHGATSASNVILPTILVSTITTLLGVFFVKIWGHRA